MKEFKTLFFSFLIVGFLLGSVGVLFYIFHWFDMFYGIYTGPILVFISLIFFILWKKIPVKKDRP